MNKNNFRQAVYELYKTDWEQKHGNIFERKQKVIQEILREDAEGSFEEYLLEYGYAGEIYVCYDEFLKAEFLDEEYVAYLLGNDAELMKKYQLAKTPNTIVNYLYRDAANNKKYNQVVLEGTLSNEQIKDICSKLESGEYFIPGQVGLPETRFGEWTDDDHVFFELGKDSFEETDDEDTYMTAQEFYNNFMAVDGWDVSAAMDRMPYFGKVVK